MMQKYAAHRLGSHFPTHSTHISITSSANYHFLLIRLAENKNLTTVETIKHSSIPTRNSACGWVFEHLGAIYFELSFLLKPCSKAFQGSGIQLSGVMHQTLPEQGRYYGILHIEQLRKRPPASGSRFEMQNWERYLFLWDRLRMAVAPPIAHLLLISPSNALPRPFLSHQSLSSTIFRGRVLQRNRNLHIFTDIVRIGGERGVDHKSISTYLKTQIYKIRKF